MLIILRYIYSDTPVPAPLQKVSAFLYRDTEVSSYVYCADSSPWPGKKTASKNDTVPG